MDARVILTDETKKKMNKKMTNHHKGTLLARRLKEVAESGKLSQARTRFDVAKLVGYTEGQRASGYAWVKRMVEIGVLTETFEGFSKYGKPEHQFFYNEKTANVRSGKRKPNPIKEEFKVAEPVVENSVEIVENSEPTVVAQTILTLYHGETTLSVEGVSGDTIIEIVKSIIK